MNNDSSKKIISSHTPPKLETSQSAEAPNTTPPTKKITAVSSKKEKIRCATCRRIITMTYIECRCGKKFCSRHIIADDHQCTYDHKKLGRDLVSKNNPKIKKQKLEKI